MKESKKGTAPRRTPDLLKGQGTIKDDALDEFVITSKEIKREMKFGKMLVCAAVFSYTAAVSLDTEITVDKIPLAWIDEGFTSLEKMEEKQEKIDGLAGLYGALL